MPRRGSAVYGEEPSVTDGAVTLRTSLSDEVQTTSHHVLPFIFDGSSIVDVTSPRLVLSPLMRSSVVRSMTSSFICLLTFTVSHVRTTRLESFFSASPFFNVKSTVYDVILV